MKIGFIGIGRIAGAVIEGLMSSAISEITIFISPRNETISTELAAKYIGVQKMSANQPVLDNADIVILALPPASAKTVLKELIFNERHTVISLIPTLKFGNLEDLTKPAANVCRAIPLPAVVNHNCPIALYNPTDEVTGLFSYLGKPFIVKDEKQLHVIWTLTGLITPFYDLLTTLSNWAVANGADEIIASRYTANLFQSLSSLGNVPGAIDYAALARHAETPKGMNEQAGKEIREQNAYDIYEKAADNLLKRFID